jgi:hypothetical protein
MQRAGLPLSDVHVVAGHVITAHIVWADREALGGAITEIDTTVVLTRHDTPIDNPDVDTGASTGRQRSPTSTAPTPTQPGCTRCGPAHRSRTSTHR